MDQPIRVRAVIFDLGGVIIRTEDPLPRTALAGRLGLTRRELEDIVFDNPVSRQAEKGMASPEDVWKKVAELLHRPIEEMPELEKDFFSGDQADLFLIDFIRKLRRTYASALLSNTWILDLEKFIADKYHILDTFDVIISSAKYRLAKPEAAIFQLALDLLHTRPVEAVFVDDSETNIRAASAMGIRTVHFRNTKQAQADLTAILRGTGLYFPKNDL